jgi:hypothetical protein
MGGGHGQGGLFNPSVRVTGAARVHAALSSWDDSQVPGFASRVGGVAPQFAAFRASLLYTYQFNVNDYVTGSIQLPHGYIPGTSLHPHVHYCLDNTAPGAIANVQWELTYALSAGIGAAFPAPGAPIVIETNSGGGVAYQEVFADLPTIAFAAGVESAIILVALRRIAASANEYGDVVHLLSWDIHFEKNKLGSAQELPPYTP